MIKPKPRINTNFAESPLHCGGIKKKEQNKMKKANILKKKHEKHKAHLPHANKKKGKVSKVYNLRGAGRLSSGKGNPGIIS